MSKSTNHYHSELPSISLSWRTGANDFVQEEIVLEGRGQTAEEAARLLDHALDRLLNIRGGNPPCP